MGLKPRPRADLKSVNAAVLGRVFGISRASIANLATDGILPRADRGLFNLPACVQAPIAMTSISGSRTSWLKRLVYMWIAAAVVLVVSIGETAAQPKSGRSAEKNPVPSFVSPEFPAGDRME